jgi:hypothetical protein
MPEQVGDTLTEDGLHFICAAIADVAMVGKDDPRHDQIFGDKPAQICLTINGVEVPFSATVTEIYRRMSKDVDERAALLAARKVEDLKAIFEQLMREPLREFNELVAKVFDVPIERVLDEYGELRRDYGCR